jgi:hypothetical protein
MEYSGFGDVVVTVVVCDASYMKHHDLWRWRPSGMR